MKGDCITYTRIDRKSVLYAHWYLLGRGGGCSFQRPLLSPPLHPLLYRSANQAWIIGYFSGSRQRLFGSSPPRTYVWETQVFPETGLLPSFWLHTAFPLDQLYTFENGRERFANFHEHKDPLGCLFKMQIPLASSPTTDALFKWN